MKTKPIKQAASRPHFRASLKDDETLELMVYGDIVDAGTMSMLESWGYSTDGFVSALGVKKALDDAAQSCSRVLVRINSPGGDAFEGVAINALLSSQPKPVECCVDGIAASAASIIFMAGGVRKMGCSAMLMIHDAWSGCVGNSRDMRKMADTLDKIDQSIAQSYMSRTGKTAEEIQSLMDEETWLSAQDCVDQGFATAVVEMPQEQSAVAMAQARQFKALGRFKTPPALAATKDPTPAANYCACRCEACMDGTCTSCSDEDCVDGSCKECPIQNPPPESRSNLSLMRCMQWQMERGIR